jgi:hypothetical protein
MSDESPDPSESPYPRPPYPGPGWATPQPEDPEIEIPGVPQEGWGPEEEPSEAPEGE